MPRNTPVMETYRGVSLSYGCDETQLSYALRHAFVRVSLDDSTMRWIDDAIAHPHRKTTLGALAVARQFMSDYDANGLLGAYDMRVLGTQQWRTLADTALDAEGKWGTLALDVGAGEGQVTDELAPLFDHIVTTELSSQMARRLRKRGYPCHQIDLAKESLPDDSAGPFDAIFALNVIDRTSQPYRLISRLTTLLKPDGVLVCSAPIPLRPHVHVGPITMPPDEILPGQKLAWEGGVSALAEEFFPACGLQVLRLTRAPYLCRGSKDAPVGALDDAIFLCNRAQLLTS